MKLIYIIIYHILKTFIEANFNELLLPDKAEIKNLITALLSESFENKVKFKAEIINLHDKLSEEHLQVFGNMNLLLIEALNAEFETKLNYFAVVFGDEPTIMKNGVYLPTLDFYISESSNSNNATFCRIYDSTNPKLCRYNIEMENKADSFISTIVDCMENIEIVNDIVSQIDENGIEQKHSECGFAFVYDKFIVETEELT
ncbi:MAG: hypothetical protein NT007_01215 [Candidatus Kapabacteria bacterium]|nr:hypothetical protein [Candidatus Kapabacteria bacterium]